MMGNNTALKIEDDKVKKSKENMDSKELTTQFAELDTTQAAEILETRDLNETASALRTLSPEKALNILDKVSEKRQAEIFAALPADISKQWKLNKTYPEDSIGRMMDSTHAVFPPHMEVKEVVQILRELVKTEFVTYAYVIDNEKKLIGMLAMRDLLFSNPESKIEDVMLKNPFSLRADMMLMDAMKEVLVKHFPLYPITNERGELVGLIRGFRLFEAQAFEISAQAGSMVGVEKEEKLSTPWTRSFKYRHPWLQLNLLTAFIAGAVVSMFQDTINQIVVLAAFLPVLAGQSGNTGCQALAVTLRGMTLGELGKEGVRKLLIKEGLLGFLNGAFVGISAGVGMYLLARSQGNPSALGLSCIVFFAMIGSCVISGLSGALVPLALKKFGADPATASSIFLTTATDVASMGMLLSLATWLLM
jgi:magnesium transporter